MKIGVLPNIFPKLSKTYVLDQVTGMLDRGHDVRLYPSYPSDESVRHPEFDAYELDRRTTYIGPPRSLGPAAAGSARNAVSLAIRRPTTVPELARTALTDGPRAAGTFTYHARTVLPDDLDVLHAHFGPVGRQAARLDRVGAAEAFVTTFHGWGIRERANYDDLFERCDAVLATSRHVRERLLDAGADPDAVDVHHVGIDPRLYDETASEVPPPDAAAVDGGTGAVDGPGDSLDDGRGEHGHRAGDHGARRELAILTVARLHEIKGLEYAIRAVDGLADRLPAVNVTYRVVGDGPRREHLESVIETLDCGDRVTLCGAKPHAAVREALGEADVFCLPSLHEGFGLVLLEAQASGLAIVASDVGGVREAVRAGESARLVPPKAPGAIADELESLARSPTERDRLGRAGRRYVRENFDVRTLNDELERRYERVLAAGDPSRRVDA
ncbi:glycosyltransferase [Halovivax limisalsi]|uniref:glycosyltransferase n=1 Tax=Halovivax limisalsi TaxID=1453760 RepID=UPI001FFD9CBE|nr:glycosyltransferase [Halovivax limisalsi]